MLLTAIATSAVAVAASSAVPQSTGSAPVTRVGWSRALPSMLPGQSGLDGRGVAAGDVDGDGDSDFVIATGSGAVLWINVGAQGFVDATAGRLPAGLTPSSKPVLADLNADGLLDLVLLAELWPAPDLVMLGAGGGVFSTPSALPMAGAVTSDIAIADLDGDGDLDIARSVGASGHGLSTGRDTLLLGDGLGGFTEDVAFTAAPWNSTAVPSTSIAVLDANRDGVADLYVTRADLGGVSGSAGEKNQLLFGTGQGRFIDASAALPNMDDNSFDAVPMDLDGDGDLDLVVANSVLGIGGSDSADVLINQGGLQGGRTGLYFDRPGSITETPRFAQALRLGLIPGDVNLDGRMDVLMRVHGLPPGSRQEVLHGAGLDFAPAAPIRTRSFVAAGGDFADVDGDGDLDLLLTVAGSAAGSQGGGAVRLFINRLR